MQRQNLRVFIREASALSERFAQIRKSPVVNNLRAAEISELVEKARELVSSITVETIGIQLPDYAGSLI